MTATDAGDCADCVRMPHVLVLIFESDEATRYLYQRELSQFYAVLLADTEQEAHQILTANAVDVLVLEPAALEDAAWSFLHAVQSSPERRPAAVVICSTLDERRRAADFAVDAYLVKPVSAATLLETVAALLGDAVTPQSSV